MLMPARSLGNVRPTLARASLLFSVVAPADGRRSRAPKNKFVRGLEESYDTSHSSGSQKKRGCVYCFFENGFCVITLTLVSSCVTRTVNGTGHVHPVTVDMEEALRDARAALELVLARLSIAFAALGSSRTVARETPSSGEI